MNVLRLAILLSTICLYAQQNLELSGVVLDAQTNLGLSYATVVIKTNEGSGSSNETITDEDGVFKFNVPQGTYSIEASLIGYETVQKTRIVLQVNKKLDPIALQPSTQNLDELVIRGEVSKTVFKLDKRVFNVGQDLASTGMSALEVLDNVPSVTVDIEGQVSLRGSAGVQLLINGKPSVLADESSNALGTITADMIEKIEVITNPSAKYEASGTAGILNIILKKNKKKGWNGSLSMNTGIPDNHSLGFSVNRRTEKFNIFSQMGVGYRSLPRYSRSKSTNFGTGEVLESDGVAYRNEGFFNISLGADYFINELNTLTLTGNFAYELEDQPSHTRFSFEIPGDETLDRWERTEDTEAFNPKWQYELIYQKKFKDDKEHKLEASAIGSFFGKKQSSEFTDLTLQGSDRDTSQQTETQFSQANFTFQLDYTKPFADTWTIETGALYNINDVGNDFEVRDLVGDDFVVSEDFTNDFRYNQNVLGVYGTAAWEGEKWGAKLGMRVENTDLKTLLVNTNEENKQNFTNLFPSGFLSYNITDDFALQLGYSKRIFRPRLWDLNPFFNIRNNFNIRRGNPNLLPEFTHSSEITSIYKIGKASFSSSVFHRFTEDQVTRVQVFEDNVTTSFPENIGTNSAWGFETNGKYSPKKWLTLTTDFNWNYFFRRGDFQEQNFDFEGKNWSLRLGSKWGLPYDIDFELTGNYRSGVRTIQGSQRGFAFADLGIRKKILKGKWVANFSMRDVFASRIRESIVNQQDFSSFDRSFRGRFVTFGLSYGFGKGEAMTYSGRRR